MKIDFSNEQLAANQVAIDFGQNSQIEMTLHSLYYQSETIIQQLRNAESNQIVVFVSDKFSIEAIFSLYLLQSLIHGTKAAHKEAFHRLDNLLHRKESQSFYNLHAIFLATRQLNHPDSTIKKVVTFLDLLFAKGDQHCSDNFIKNTLLHTPVFSKEVLFLQEDYRLFLEEINDQQQMKRESFQVLDYEGNLSKVKGKIRFCHSQAALQEYWYEKQQIALLLTKIDKEIIIKKLNPKINLKNLCKTLAFFEQGENNWIEQDNQIVCSASILTMNTIIDILKHYTNPWVKQQKVKYVFPFHFNYQSFKQITQYFNSQFTLTDESDKHQKFKRTFLPLFNDYLFNNRALPNKQLHSKNFDLCNNSSILFKEKEILLGAALEQDPLDCLRHFDVDLRLFQYGVGFLTLTNTYRPEEEVPYHYILQMDEMICGKVSEIFHHYVGESPHFNLDATRRGIVYESIEISYDSYVLARKENLVLMACSATKRTYIADEKELKQELEEKYLSRGDFVFYGFSRSCGVQFVVDNSALSKTGLERLTENFLEEKFYIFLFAIQQRDAIRQFSDKLVRGSLLKQKVKANKIRKDFIEFVTQVRLSHISDNNVATRFYNRWRSIFDSDVIYQEVAEKLDVIDGFQQSRLSHQFNFLSFVVFPVIAISSLFSMGIFSTDAIYIDLPYVIIISLSLLGLFFLFTNKK